MNIKTYITTYTLYTLIIITMAFLFTPYAAAITPYNATHAETGSYPQHLDNFTAKHDVCTKTSGYQPVFEQDTIAAPTYHKQLIDACREIATNKSIRYKEWWDRQFENIPLANRKPLLQWNPDNVYLDYKNDYKDLSPGFKRHTRVICAAVPNGQSELGPTKLMSCGVLLTRQ